MRRDAPYVSPDDTIETVAKLLATHHLPGVAVLKDGELVGIITETDLVFRESDVSAPSTASFLDAIVIGDAGTPYEDDLRRVLAVTAGQLMTSPVFSIRSSATLHEVATLMIERQVNPVPVIDQDNTLAGLVSRADLVRVIARLEQGDVPLAELNNPATG